VPPAGFPGGPPVKTQEDPAEVMVTRPSLKESDLPLLSDAEVSIHELDDEDLELVDDNDDNDDNDSDTGIRQEAELPEHLRKAIAEAKEGLDD
jgi:hypothetical protein